VRAGHNVEITVPFTVEEIENLATLAAAQGASLVDLIRARVFSPVDDAIEAFSADNEDPTIEKLTTLMARLEGIRIRSRGRRRH
jgi:hypothetical protein